MQLSALFSFVLLATSVYTNDHPHEHEDQMPLDYVRFPYEAIYHGINGEVTADSIFSGIATFAKLPWVQCLTRDSHIPFDIAFIGAPFVSCCPPTLQELVSKPGSSGYRHQASAAFLQRSSLPYLHLNQSYRPGARFGPSGIRAGSRRLTLCGGYNVPLKVNPFQSGLRIVDCGDIPVTPYDNKYAIEQIENGHNSLLRREAFSPLGNDSVTGEALVPLSLDGKHHPRIITLGGDHTIVLPLLRSINSVYGRISVIHFDSHLDTWKPSVFGGAPSDQAAINHGTYFYWASQEGLIQNGSSIGSALILVCSFQQHGAIRTTLSGPEDYYNDDETGFQRIEAREIDVIGTDGIIKKIRDTVGDNPVYLSIDIDSIDPAFAPATGTPETGGWSTRELRTILRGLEGMHIVSADIVEVAPAYDTNAELTTMAAADILFEVLSVMAKNKLGKVRIQST
ncbi:Agmatinase [Mycena venus]|uniref:Agmatinase n=1 Tax=Mycena venus TaxID=2733690 RepID=A0A8H6YJ67_9AGAR|nr:Agmatinase [Mycena venus]